jgi:hypothetical protein
MKLTVLIYTALLHDTGIVVSKDEIKQIGKDGDNITPRKYSLILKNVKMK